MRSNSLTEVLFKNYSVQLGKIDKVLANHSFSTRDAQENYDLWLG